MEMCDDIVQASPGNKKRRRRRRWTKSPKKVKGQDESSSFEISAFTNKTTWDLSTNEERSVTSGCEQSIALCDISQIYGAQAIEDETDVGAVDILAYANLLEKAALQGPEKRPSSTIKPTATRAFTAACDLLGLQEGSSQANTPNSSQLNASGVSGTQVLRLCEAADIIEEIKKSDIELSSQWECSWRRTQPGPSAISIMDTIDLNTQDSMAQDILRDCISQDIIEPSPRREPPPRNEQKFSRAPETYSRLRARKQKDRQTAKRLADRYDSDSKSSLSSELSIQNDDLLESTPTDSVDLHRSFRVCENLQNLSSFFSQSFNQEEHDATVDGVYKRIMALKAKRWESRLFDWYKSGKNFRLSEDDSSGSSAPFEGFRSDELNSLHSESTCKSKDISSFLDDDEDLFHAVRATCLVSNMSQGGSGNTQRGRSKEEGTKHLDGALNETIQCNRFIKGALDNYLVTTKLKNPMEEIVARMPCGNREKNNITTNPNLDTEEGQKYVNALPNSPRKSQIWADENLLCEFTTPIVNTSAQHSVKGLINTTGCIVPKTDENENSTEFDKDIVRTGRCNSFKVTVSEPPTISSVLKDSRYKLGESSVETQIRDNFLKGASQWNANTSFPGCEVELTQQNLGDDHNMVNKAQSLPDDKIEKEISRKVPERSMISLGFQSARGNAIQISEEGMLRARNLWAEVDNFTEQNLENEANGISASTRFNPPSIREETQRSKLEQVKETKVITNNFEYANQANQNTLKEINHCTDFGGFRAMADGTIQSSGQRKTSVRTECDSKTDQNSLSTFDEGKGCTGLKSRSGKPILDPREIKARASQFVAKVDAFIKDRTSQEEELNEELKSNLASKGTADRARNHFVKLDAFNRDRVDQDPLKGFGESKCFAGFKSVSGKPILVSKEATHRASKVFAEVDAFIRDGADQASLKYLEQTKGFTGFKSVSGTTVLVSDAGNKASNLFDEVNAFVGNGVNQDPLKGFGVSEGFTGFRSVSGKPILISKEATNRASNLFPEVDAILQDGADHDTLKDFDESKGFTGLKTVAGKPVVISKEAKNRASNLFAEVNKNTADQDTIKCFKETKAIAGFKTVSGKSILISNKGQHIANKLFSEVDALIVDMPEEHTQFESPLSAAHVTKKDFKLLADDKTAPHCFEPEFKSLSEQEFLKESTVNKSNPQGAITGFRTVSGKVLKISDAGQCVANKFLTELNNWTENDFLTDVEGQPASTTNTMTKPLIDDIRSETQQMYNRFNEKENIIRTPSASETGVARIQSSCKRPIGSCFENTLGKSATSLGDDNPTKRLKSSNPRQSPAAITSRNQATTNCSPQRTCNAPLKPLTLNEFVTPVKSKPVLHEFNTPDLQQFFNLVETSTPRTMKKKNNFSLSQEISASTAALAADELKLSTVTDDFHTIKWDDFEDSFHDKSESKVVKKVEDESDVSKLPEKVPEIVTKIRDDLRQKLDRIIEEKENLPRQMCSTALYRKNTEKNRQKLTDIVGNQKPKVLTVNELIIKGLRAEVAQLQFTLAQAFKFSEPLKGRTFVMAESTYIIPDEYNKIGLHEIKRAFLTIPSVYKTLLPEGWVDHHYKMILLKLAMLEKSFPESFANQLCTPENMIMQLSYRYDREIDRAERSCLKRILENDDSPAKRMVLLVLDVEENNGEVELELTDWWYSVRASVDLAMMDLVRRGKVNIGTKLMIQGSKLLNCDNGYSPLEMSPQVRLKIHTNSCRRAVWDLKLGFFKNPKPFYIALDSVKENGGLIFKLKLHVLRVYPTVYLTRTGGSKGIHSQKVEERLRKDEEKIDFENFELIFSQVQHELQQERMTKRKGAKFSSTVNDPEELYKLIDEGYDLEDIEVDLSPDELNRVVKYQQEVLLRRMDEVNHRVKEKLHEQVEKRSSTQLVKIRVIDLKYPKSSAVLSLWRPSENLREMLKEGISIEVTNCTPNGVRYGDMQLSSTKNSEFNFISEKLTISGIQHMLRRVVKIKEINSADFVPVFNELDTVGFVVMITNAEQRKCQSVFLCDAEENILCINFWNGLKEYAYDDVIQNGRFIAASNLQTRANSKTGIVPCLFATEISVFTENPKTVDMRNTLTALKNSLIGTDLSTLSSKCVEQIESFRKMNVSGNSFATPIRKSLSCTKLSFHNTLEKNSPAINTSDVPSPQNRIDRLKMYGQPPDLSPIALKIKPAVRSSFKLPRKFGEDSQNDSR